MSLQFDLFSDYSSELGEGPFWDSKRSRLHWVDIIGKKIISQNLDGSNIHALEVDGNPGCVVLSDEGTMIAGVDNQISSFDGGGNLLNVLADTNEGSGLRFNDGKCDPTGRFWVGSMDRKEKNKLGSLYSWSSVEGLVNREQGVTVSNGMGWSPDIIYSIILIAQLERSVSMTLIFRQVALKTKESSLALVKKMDFQTE